MLYMALLILLLLVTFVTVDSKNLKYLMLLLPILFVNLLMNKFNIIVCMNFTQLFILFNIFVVEILRKLPSSDKIRVN